MVEIENLMCKEGVKQFIDNVTEKYKGDSFKRARAILALERIICERRDLSEYMWLYILEVDYEEEQMKRRKKKDIRAQLVRLVAERGIRELDAYMKEHVMPKLCPGADPKITVISEARAPFKMVHVFHCSVCGVKLGEFKYNFEVNVAKI